jgi:adenylyl- and sulfurtransferase ThiI
VFGVSSAVARRQVPKDLEQIAALGAGVLVRAARDGRPARSRSSAAVGQALPARTFEINDVVGQAARLRAGSRSTCRIPTFSLVAEIGPELSFVSAHSARGPSGLPSA